MRLRVPTAYLDIVPGHALVPLLMAKIHSESCYFTTSLFAPTLGRVACNLDGINQTKTNLKPSTPMQSGATQM